MNPRTRSRMPASIGSNQASPANSAGPSACVLVLSCSMAWSPPALERRKWLVGQARDYATNPFPPHPRRHRKGSDAVSLFRFRQGSRQAPWPMRTGLAIAPALRGGADWDGVHWVRVEGGNGIATTEPGGRSGALETPHRPVSAFDASVVL